MRRIVFASFVLFSLTFGFIMSNTAFAFTGNQDADTWDQYANTKIVYEGELCGDVDQNAKKGGNYYQCDLGLSCDFFPQSGNKVEEAYGRCVVNERYLCEATGGELYDDMSCNCPLKETGGCDGNLINVTQKSTYDVEKNELNIEITAKNTSSKSVSWSEYGSGCSATNNDIFGVKVKYFAPPFAFSPTPNPHDLYIVGDVDNFYEFTQSGGSYSSELQYACMAYVKNTFHFGPHEVKKASITIPSYLLSTIAYTVEAKYGGSFAFKSGNANAYKASCTNGKTMINGRCDYIVPPVENIFDFYDIKGHWAEGYIQNMLDMRVVEGYKNHYYYPNQAVTRAEFIKMLMKALDYELKQQPATERQFADVRVGDWYTDYIYTAALDRIIDGYLDGTFRPNEEVSRAEALALALRAAHIEPYTYSHTFFYDVVTYWQKPYIETAYRLNLINGKGGGRFDPEGRLTRAEAAKIVSNILSHDQSNAPEAKPNITETYNIWPK